MKILFVTLGFFPSVAWGGPVKITYQNALELQRLGHDVTICATNLLNKHEYIEPRTFERDYEGLKIVYLHTYSWSNWPGTLGPTGMPISALRRLWDEVKKADVVHVNGVRLTLSMMGLIFSKKQNKPVVMQPHGVLPHIVASIKLKAVFDKIFVGYLFSAVHAFIAGQQSEEEQIVKAGGDRKRVYQIANGMDCTTYDPEKYRGILRRTYNIGDEEKIILFLGRINWKKGTDLLVKAFAQLPDSLKATTRLVIAGPDDGQLAEVKELMKEHHLEDRVILPGLLDGDLVSGAYVDADIFVLPCRTDTFPMAIIEACQASTPMVICESCEISDLLKDKVAKIVPVSPEGIAAGLQEVLENDTLRAEYVAGSKVLMDTKFSITAVGKELEALYQQVYEEVNG